MTADQWCAILGGVLVALVIRLSNMLTEFLARVLHVNPPEPIPVGPGEVRAAPVPTTGQRTPTGHVGTNGAPVVDQGGPPMPESQATSAPDAAGDDTP